MLLSTFDLNGGNRKNKSRQPLTLSVGLKEKNIKGSVSRLSHQAVRKGRLPAGLLPTILHHCPTHPSQSSGDIASISIVIYTLQNLMPNTKSYTFQIIIKSYY